jgi:hypothetical protein
MRVSITGYQFAAENYKGDSITEAEGLWLNEYPDSMSAEDMLNAEAKIRGIDRDDEYSFDSDDFPKVVLSITP